MLSGASSSLDYVICGAGSSLTRGRVPGKVRQSDSSTEVWYTCESSDNQPPVQSGDASTAQHYRETTFAGNDETEVVVEESNFAAVVSETRQVSTLESITEEWCETMMQTSSGHRDWCETQI